MSRHAAEMPDDALPTDSLVGAMLRPEPVSDPYKLEPPATVEPPPLWRVMDRARFVAALEDDDDGKLCAAEIEALRDWLLGPEEPEPVDLIRDQSRTASTAWQRWDERMSLRALLTEQARIAREQQS